MSKRILAADDSASMRQVIRLTLSTAGHEVVDAVDGEDALAKLNASQFNLIITDLNMPKLDGLGLIKAVRANAAHRLTPILMVTTESAQDLKQQGRAAGASGWISKPFAPDQLLAVVKRFLGP